MNKYFISFAFTDNTGIPRFGNCYYTCNKNIDDLNCLNAVTKDVAEANKIKDVVIMYYNKIND